MTPDAEKAELERLKRELHDIKCPHCKNNFWFVYECGKYPQATVLCSHQIKADSLRAMCEKMAEALERIRDNPTSDSANIINNRNNWTDWAKRRASEAIAEYRGMK
jgi:hypothetical protein